jgi:alkylresorcinol/alkylpyrone synthase
MGFRAAPDGYAIVLALDVPEMAARELPRLVEEIMAPQSPSTLAFHVLHPGGTKVVERVTATLGLEADDVASAWRVLRANGNMSSPTVLFVLAETLRDPAPEAGARGLLAAFGPGFAAELVLLEATA